MSQEDAHFAYLQLPLPPGMDAAAKRGVSMFGIFDGHGGSAVSQFVAKHLWLAIASQPTFEKGDYLNAIKQGFYQTDNSANADPGVDCEQTGCTAIVAMLTQSNALFVGNAGDCRAVLSAEGVAIPLSLDHKADAPTEQARILAAGGQVIDERIMGDLAVSRSLGDFRFKRAALPLNQQMVSPEPDISARRLLPTDELLLLGCDGIFDTIGDQEAIDFIRTRIAQDKTLKQIVTELLDRCLAPEPNEYSVGTDNTSATIIAFLNGKSESEWRSMVKQNLVTRPATSKTTLPGMSPLWDDVDIQEYLRLKEQLSQ